MIRRAIAVVVCSAAMLAYWLGYGAILNGSAFGVPFGWAFGAAATAFGFAVPLIVDRDDPGFESEKWVGPAAVAFALSSSAVFGAGIVLHGSREYLIGGALGALAGGGLSYWANGDDRKQRGVPRVSGRAKAGQDRHPPETASATPPALPRP